MAIAQVGGAAQNFTSVTTQAITYSATAGNVVTIFIAGTPAISNVSCVDNLGSPLVAGPTAAALIFSFYYICPHSGVTSFTLSWTTTSTGNIEVEEYSGALGGVNAGLAGNSASATSATATITVTTQDNNDWIVGGIASNGQVVTITVGNQRQASALGTIKLKLADNTVVTAGAVSITGTLTSALWAIVVLELRSVAIAGGGTTSNWLSKAVATGINRH